MSTAHELRVGLMTGEKAVPLLAAAHTGAFARRGVAVRLTVVTGAAERDAAFLAGEFDVALMNLVSVLRIHMTTAAMRIMTNLLDGPGEGGMFRLLAGPAEPPAGGPAEARARPVLAVSRGTIADFSAFCLLGLLDRDWEEVTVVDIQDITARGRALVGGAVDWAVLPEPAGSWCLSRGCTVMATDRTLTPPGPALCTAAGERAPEAGAAAAFLAACRDGAAAVAASPGLAREVLTAHGIETDDRWSPPPYRIGGLPTVADVAAVLEWMASTAPGPAGRSGPTTADRSAYAIHHALVGRLPTG
ncbi:hypothetical protein [Streptomyces sp. NPDC059479]|uniref:hypothetical protein n=1 Tax=Streptomyces sp. NPDC059479 TaxID=3346848 RepID=UPI00368E4B0F